MTKLITHWTAPAVRFHQKGNELYFLAVPASKAVDVLGFDQLLWEEKESAFAGFNRSIKQKHVAQIVHGLSQHNAIMPNPIIAYFLASNFKFEKGAGQTGSVSLGEATILVPENGREEESITKVGFVIDGQHRVSALSRLEFEEGEEELTVGLMALRGPEDKLKKDDFERLVLEAMATINSAMPLSRDDTLLVNQRLLRVTSQFGLKKAKEATADLIVRELDLIKECPVKFKAANKTPPRGTTWLNLGVWVKAVVEALDSQTVLRKVFDGDFSESPEKREKVIKILDLYFRAVYGLISDRDWWEKPQTRQRLYHNVGMFVVLGLLDDVNSQATVVSAVEPGKLLKSSDEDSVKAFQKELIALRFMDWSVGERDSDKPEDLEPLKMAGIQQQKAIPVNLRKSVEELRLVCKETAEGRKKNKYLLKVSDSQDVPVCRQTIELAPAKLKKTAKAVENGDFLDKYAKDD